ncbi:GNAT family N-acetyltransferase [Jeotgalibaca ciconiae]|nr:GNAT family N-acetyltransferase [Jeotgalibaca ciconiae]
MTIYIKQIDEIMLESIFEELIELKNYSSSLHFNNANEINNYNRVKTKELFQYIPQYKAFLFGAFEEEKLIGFIWGYPRTFFNEERIFINSLVVSKSYQNRGIGKKLIEKIKLFAKDTLNYQALDLTVIPTNDKAIKLYENLGFKSERIQMRLEL